MAEQQQMSDEIADFFKPSAEGEDEALAELEQLEKENVDEEMLNNAVPKGSIKANPGTVHAQPVVAKPQAATNLDDLINA